MDITAFEQLKNQQFITDADFEKIKTLETTQPVSLHWDLRTLLYFGIFLLTTGLGIVIYKSIDTIGHDIIIAVIAFCCACSFFYCTRKSKGYSNMKVELPNVLFDYILLLGCLLLLTFIGYLQFQYNVFGNRWGLATFIPMVLLFVSAYYFDHIGVLSLAITNLAAWVGISVTPLQILDDNDFGSERLILSGIALGAGLVAIAVLAEKKNVKKHFAFTYSNFGTHILFIACIAALFHFEEIFLLVFLLFSGVAFFFYKKALKENSFYFLVATLLYSYIAISYVVIRLLDFSGAGIGMLYLSLVYFIGSGIVLIRLLMRHNKIIKSNDRL